VLFPDDDIVSPFDLRPLPCGGVRRLVSRAEAYRSRSDPFQIEAQPLA
jgi:hypothetical protein